MNCDNKPLKTVFKRFKVNGVSSWKIVTKSEEQPASRKRERSSLHDQVVMKRFKADSEIKIRKAETAVATFLEDTKDNFAPVAELQTKMESLVDSHFESFMNDPEIAKLLSG